jgi:hypothetical protein
MMLVAGFEPAPHELKARCSILFCYTSNRYPSADSNCYQNCLKDSYATITPDGRFI